MIFPLAGLFIGAVLGAIQARRKGGNGKDQAQWAVVFAMIFGVIGVFVMVLLDRALS